MTAKIKLNAASGGGSVSLEAPTSTTGNANIELKLPVADGSGFLKSDGSGNLSNSLTTSGTDNFTIADGNLVIGTAGHGIDFSATSGTGTSELLADYEEGTWTPTLNSGNSLASSAGRYVKIGAMVYAFWHITMASNSDSAHLIINNLPFTSINQDPSSFGTAKDYQTYDIQDGPIYHVPKNNTQIQFYKNSGQNLTESNGSGLDFRGCSIYQT